MRRKLLAPLIFFLLILEGCGVSDLLTTVDVKITPDEATVGRGQQVQFKGTETTQSPTGGSINISADAFAWTLVEGAAGGTLVKTQGDTITYTYTAPGNSGVFHVEIRSKQDPTQVAEAVITVN